jgi:hypothetical protein
MQKHALLFALALSSLGLSPTPSAQGREPAPPPPPRPQSIPQEPVQEPAQEERPAALDTNGRVQRSLNKLKSLADYEYRVQSKGQMGGLQGVIIRQVRMGINGGEKKKDPGTIVKKKGEVLVWKRNDGQYVLARHGAKYATRESEGTWTPSRRVVHPLWKNQFLAEPGFLAEVLLGKKSQVEWERTNIITLEGRPVRCYRAMLEGDLARHLGDTGALPSAGDGFGRVIRMIGGAGGGLQVPKGELKTELLLYIHPSSRLPLRIEVRNWYKQAGNVQVMFGGAGGGQPEEEEETEEEGPDGKMRKKPTSTVFYELLNSRDVQLDELDDEAQMHLGLPRKGV